MGETSVLGRQIETLRAENQVLRAALQIAVRYVRWSAQENGTQRAKDDLATVQAALEAR